MSAQIYLGTSGWSYKDWEGLVYTPGSKSNDYLKQYAERFPIVEIDSTFYGVPRKSTVDKWREETPDGFLFAPKFPKEITHDRELQDCEDILKRYLDTMSGLGEKLGPLLMQFGYGFKPDKFDLLEAFLDTLPDGYKYALEVRNKNWLGEAFYDMLAERGIALTLVDHAWMPWMDTLTTDWTYIRWLGDRKKIPKDFNKEYINRTEQLVRWAEFLKRIQEKVVAVYGFFNNHYEGFSPGSMAKFDAFLKET